MRYGFLPITLSGEAFVEVDGDTGLQFATGADEGSPLARVFGDGFKQKHLRLAAEEA